MHNRNNPHSATTNTNITASSSDIPLSCFSKRGGLLAIDVCIPKDCPADGVNYWDFEFFSEGVSLGTLTGDSNDENAVSFEKNVPVRLEFEEKEVAQNGVITLTATKNGTVANITFMTVNCLQYYY